MIKDKQCMYLVNQQTNEKKYFQKTYNNETNLLKYNQDLR